MRIETRPSSIGAGRWAGMILRVDRFGNLITNFHVDDLADVRTRPFEVRIADRRIHRLALTFSDAAVGELAAVVGSSGYLEIAANQASAAAMLGCGARAPVDLEIYDTGS